jgi:hypothetical protein
MQLSVRPYVTAGVAIVGASVIAIAPIQPTTPDVHIPNPVAQVARDVQLTAEATAGEMIEAQYNDLILQVTELGLSLTVPLTAALIDALGVDTMGPPETAATLLLLGLSGYAISGVGSVGTALGGVIDGFGCPAEGGLCEDIGTGYVALLVGAPSTIIEGFVLGGFGPDLSGVLEDAGVPLPPGEVFAGGLIQNPGLFQTPLGIQLCSQGLGCGSNLESGDAVLPSFFFTLQGLAERSDLLGRLDDLGGLLGGLLDNLPVFGLPGLTSLTGSDTSSIASTENAVTPNNKRLAVDVATDLGTARGKHAAPDVSFRAPLSGLPGQARVAQAAKDVVDVVDRTAHTDRDQTFGRDVAEAASKRGANGGTPVVRNSPSFVPETGKKSGGKSGGSNRAGATLSSTAKNFGDAVSGAVKGALGGGAKDGGSKDGGSEDDARDK